THDAHDDRPHVRAEDEDEDVLGRRAEVDDRGQRDEDRRKRGDRVAQSHDHGVEPTAVVAGERAEQRADERRNDRRDERDLLGRAHAVQRERQHVAADRIRPERMAERRRLVHRGEIHELPGVRLQQARARTGDQDPGDDDERGDADGLTHEPLQRLPAETALPLRERRALADGDGAHATLALGSSQRTAPSPRIDIVSTKIAVSVTTFSIEYASRYLGPSPAPMPWTSVRKSVPSPPSPNTQSTTIAAPKIAPMSSSSAL